MKRLLIVLSCAAAVLFLSTPAIAQSAHVHGGKARLQVSTPLQVGSTTIQPGDYKFQCRNIDGTDYLVVTFAATGKEAARVPCKPEMLDKKVSESVFLTVLDPGGTKKLVEVRIKGETIAHAVVE
jgi:hypothetical protein